MSIGIWQILLIAAVFLLLFGAGKIPQMMKDLGSGVTAFKRGLREEDKALENKSTDKNV